MELSTKASVDDVEYGHGRPKQEDSSTLEIGLSRYFFILDLWKSLHQHWQQQQDWYVYLNRVVLIELIDTLHMGSMPDDIR